jgi:hypothetical protein
MPPGSQVLRVLAAATGLVLSASAPQEPSNLLADGDAKSRGAWVAIGPAEFEHDREAGAGGKGSLAIRRAAETAKDVPTFWSQWIELAEEPPARLALSAQVRAREFAPGTQAYVLAHVWPESGNALASAQTDIVAADGDWRAGRAVLDVPSGARRIHVLAVLTGAGQAWFDDLVLVPTDDPVTAWPKAPESGVEALARGCAADLPWLFDGDEARKRAKAERKPVLLYVRCTDDEKGLASARSSIEAADIPVREDGYAKDLLFRAGPLSSPEVRDLIARRTVPACATYELGKSRFEREKLLGFDVFAADVTTPALVLCRASGEPVGTLHRIGTQSDDLIDHWLRESLERARAPSGETDPVSLYRDGELEALLKKSAADPLLGAKALVRLGKLEEARKKLATCAGGGARDAVAGWIALRGGDWEQALERYGSAANQLNGEEATEAAFWGAWATAMLGRHAEARQRWSSIAGTSVAGRRAAACALEDGPRPFLAMSVRSWPRAKELAEQTEGEGDLELARSTAALLELQRDDGSFGGHLGVGGYGSTDPAITAIAFEALTRVAAKVPEALTKRIQTARERALGYLKTYAGAENPAFRAMDPFNLAYALPVLCAEREREPAKALVARIAALQLPDGNWTVYHPGRPASFNTALCVLALRAAEQAKIELPEKTLARGLDALDAMRVSSGLFPYSSAPNHEWMTTDHGSIGRDPLCEHALLACGRGSKASLAKALQRFLEHHGELRSPTKRLYDYFDERGHGGYFFFFAYRNALEAARAFAPADLTRKVDSTVRSAVLACQEGDGTWMDHYMIGRAYGTAMALLLLVE